MRANREVARKRERERERRMREEVPKEEMIKRRGEGREEEE